MPGFELMGEEEKKALLEIFEQSGGVLFAHGFDDKREGIFRVREFERKFAGRFNVKYSQAVASGTAALKVALKALGVKPGDEVITQAFTFVATVEAILDCNAVPVIVDVDETLNMSSKSLKKAISAKTKVVIPVHMLGVSAEMNEILSLCKERRISILEDNAQSCGGTYNGRYLGTIGEVGCFSFDFGKIITSGEGGMVVTNKEDYFIKARSYQDHGHEYSKTLSKGKEAALMPGFNFRMSEMQAAVGMVQLGKLDRIIERQRANKRSMKEFLLQNQQKLQIHFRKISDEKGDIGDALIFFVGSKKRALEIASRLLQANISPKNLPGALRWHFAGEWDHIFGNHPYYSSDWKTRWDKSRELLEQAIALPVFVKDDEKIIKEKMKIVAKALEETI